MIFYVVVFIFILGAVYLLAASLANIKYRPRLHFKPEAFAFRQQTPYGVLQKRSLPRILKPLNYLIQIFSRWAYFRRIQEQADVLRIEVNLPVMILFKLLLGIAIGIMVFVLLSPMYALPAAGLGFFIPDFLMWNKIKAKKEHIIKVFPETVDLLDMCISAGQDFLSAIKWVIDKSIPNAFIEQLGIVLGEIQVGKTRADALRDMSRRLKLADVSSFSRTIIQAERMGTSIEEAFKNLSDDTRERRFQNGERYAIKASLKILFPLLFCILPAIMIVVAGPVLIKFMQGELMPKAVGL